VSLKEASGVALAVYTAAAGAVAFVAAILHTMTTIAVQAAVVLGSKHCGHFFWVGKHVGLGRHGQVDVAVALAVNRTGAGAVAFVATIFQSGAAATFKAAVIFAVDLHGAYTSSDGYDRRKNHKATDIHF
jgi:hypothetical protein